MAIKGRNGDDVIMTLGKLLWRWGSYYDEGDVIRLYTSRPAMTRTAGIDIQKEKMMDENKSADPTHSRVNTV